MSPFFGGGGGGSTETIEVTVANQSSVTVNHNLGYKPFFKVENSDGEEVSTYGKDESNNAFTVKFTEPFTGKIIYR